MKIIHHHKPQALFVMVFHIKSLIRTREKFEYINDIANNFDECDKR